MATATKSLALAEDSIINKIYYFRKQKVMLDRDLAELYGVQPKRLREQVKRNIGRFPAKFVFKLTKQATKLRCRILRHLTTFINNL